MDSSRSSSADLGEALENLPLFPLPELVLLPGALLPLHIFEPRYRKLVRDLLDAGSDGPRALGIVCVPDPAQVDAAGMPEIAKVAGLGTMVDCSELPSGRFNILVRGRARVSLEELPFVSPYRRARARVLWETEVDVSSTLTAGLISAASAFSSLVRTREKSFDFRMPKLSDAGTLADHCAQQLLIDARDRQKVLETTSVVERVRLVTETLALQQLTLGGDHGPAN